MYEYMYLITCSGYSISQEMGGHCKWDMPLNTGPLQIFNLCEN
jgi:hypothetical protein